MKAAQSIDPSVAGREKLVNTYDNGVRFQVDEFFRELVSETTNKNYAVLYTSDHGQTLSEHGQAYTHMKPDQEIVDVPEFIVSGEEYGKQALLDGIAPGIRVSHLNNFATLLDLMEVPMSLRVRTYDTSIFALTEEDNSERCYMSGSLHGFGDYVVKSIPSPPDAAGAFRDLSARGPMIVKIKLIAPHDLAESTLSSPFKLQRVNLPLLAALTPPGHTITIVEEAFAPDDHRSRGGSGGHHRLDRTCRTGLSDR